jgi:membrane protein
MVKEAVHEDATDVRVSPLVSMSRRELISMILVGVAVGAIISVLYFLLNKFIFSAVLCRPQSTADCGQAPNYAMIVAMLVGSIGGVVGLARTRIYRPLLIVIVSVIALWGIQNVLMGLDWYWAMMITAVFFGLAYGVFGWLARIRNFILAIVLVAVLTVLVRWVLVA